MPGDNADHYMLLLLYLAQRTVRNCKPNLCLPNITLPEKLSSPGNILDRIHHFPSSFICSSAYSLSPLQMHALFLIAQFQFPAISRELCVMPVSVSLLASSALCSPSEGACLRLSNRPIYLSRNGWPSSRRSSAGSPCRSWRPPSLQISPLSPFWARSLSHQAAPSPRAVPYTTPAPLSPPVRVAPTRSRTALQKQERSCLIYSPHP